MAGDSTETRGCQPEPLLSSECILSSLSLFLLCSFSLNLQPQFLQLTGLQRALKTLQLLSGGHLLWAMLASQEPRSRDLQKQARGGKWGFHDDGQEGRTRGGCRRTERATREAETAHPAGK